MKKDRYYIDIKTGDTVEVIETMDDDFAIWIESQNETTFKIESLCDESELIWLKNCPYAVAMADVIKV